jgi:hypothetical protein
LIQHRQLIGMEEALQQQDRAFPALLAQQDRLFQVEQGETIRRA